MKPFKGLGKDHPLYDFEVPDDQWPPKSQEDSMRIFASMMDAFTADMPTFENTNMVKVRQVQKVYDLLKKTFEGLPCTLYGPERIDTCPDEQVRAVFSFGYSERARANTVVFDAEKVALLRELISAADYFYFELHEPVKDSGYEFEMCFGVLDVYF